MARWCEEMMLKKTSSRSSCFIVPYSPQLQ
jgi:hypothetical protein